MLMDRESVGTAIEGGAFVKNDVKAPLKNGMDARLVELKDMEVGECGHVARISATGELGRRIRDMGLVPGSHLCVTGRAPLNDPLSIRLHGYTLSLRGSEASYIWVERDNGQQ